MIACPVCRTCPEVRPPYPYGVGFDSASCSCGQFKAFYMDHSVAMEIWRQNKIYHRRLAVPSHDGSPPAPYEPRWKWTFSDLYDGDDFMDNYSMTMDCYDDVVIVSNDLDPDILYELVHPVGRADFVAWFLDRVMIKGTLSS